MAKYSMKRDGKEVGPAAVYAEPHTMDGKKLGSGLPAMSTKSGREYMDEMNISVGNVSKGNYKPTKTSGIEVRGGKAQTKGKMARGPMA
jgi:hypothetical protein